MGEDQVRGKSIAAIAKDVANGFFTVNPLTLKKLTPETIMGLHIQLRKTQTEVRNTRFDAHDMTSVRNRNMRLQRLHQALAVLEHTAKERKITL